MRMVDWIFNAALALTGIVHLLPVVGALSAERLGALYGVRVEAPDVILLLRHRAVLFGILGAFLLASIYWRALQPAALLAGMVSMVAFLVLYWTCGETGTAIKRVYQVDCVIVVLLGLAGAAKYMVR